MQLLKLYNERYFFKLIKEYLMINKQITSYQDLLRPIVEKTILDNKIDRSEIEKVRVNCRRVEYSQDKSPSGMQDVEIEIPQENGQSETVLLSDRFSTTLEDIKIIIEFKNKEIKEILIEGVIEI
jgi:hypothetical protein